MTCCNLVIKIWTVPTLLFWVVTTQIFIHTCNKLWLHSICHFHTNSCLFIYVLLSFQKWPVMPLIKPLCQPQSKTRPLNIRIQLVCTYLPRSPTSPRFLICYPHRTPHVTCSSLLSVILFCFLLTHLRNFAIRISSLSSLLFPWAGFLLCLPSPSPSFHLPCFNINSLHFKLTIFPFSFTAAIYFWYFCIHHHSNWHHPFLLLIIFIFIITPFPLVYPLLFYFILFLSPFTPLSVLRFVLFSVRQPKPPKLQTPTCAAQCE